MKKLELIAKRCTGNSFDLYQLPMQVPFARLTVDHNNVWTMKSGDEQMQHIFNGTSFAPDAPLKSILLSVRAMVEYLDEQQVAEYRAEAASEQALMNILETNDEHRHEMEWQDAMGYT